MKKVKLYIFTAGYCTCPEHIAIKGGRYQNIRFPAMFAYIEHPNFGGMLFDTGYSNKFFTETATLPAKFYRLLTPVTLQEEQLAINQLAKINVRPSDITRIFISHFHADHISALGDFPKAKFSYLAGAYDAIKKLNGMRALSHAFLPGLLPHDFADRSEPILSSPIPLPPEFFPFTAGYDLLGDNSIIAVELPGHATGQMGIFCQNTDNKIFFFIADAAWLKNNVINNTPPHWITNLLFTNPTAYKTTLNNLHILANVAQQYTIIPSHCEETLIKFSYKSE